MSQGPWQSPGLKTSVYDIILLQPRSGQTCRKGPRLPSKESTEGFKFFPLHFL